jgi:hypothetical protein
MGSHFLLQATTMSGLEITLRIAIVLAVVTATTKDWFGAC